ncbi:MAG: hypothetical protein ACFCGT_08120 [Sandaracinaceae bacterium]
MRAGWVLAVASAWLVVSPALGQRPRQPAERRSASPTPSAHAEDACGDGRDDDGDGLIVCADADCFGAERCQAGGGQERNDERCSDWVDNAGDGATDCDDADCGGPGIGVCAGSWEPPLEERDRREDGAIPVLTGDVSVEDLIGRGSDRDGERNDYLCSDGRDNDGDGRTDCQDFGCRFDPSVGVCHGSPGIRFGVVAGIAGSVRLTGTADIDGDGRTRLVGPAGDVRFTRIQLRVFGAIPFLEDSFFLLNLRAERRVRLTFATFNVPLGATGHYLSINSGSGGLSPGLIVSTSKQPLLDPPYYLFNAFERGAGAALEVGGPITADGRLRYRAFAMGGSGEFDGNVGGRFFRADDSNFAYAGGAQLHWNLVGHYDRFDSPFLYTEVPATVALVGGARYDQRPVERYVAWNVFAIARASRFLLRAESYSRFVLDFEGINTAFNVQASILLVPRRLMLAVDGGGFFTPLPYLPRVLHAVGGYDAAFPRPLDRWQARGALHWYYFRSSGILSLLYAASFFEANPARPEEPITEHELRLEAQLRF